MSRSGRRVKPARADTCEASGVRVHVLLLCLGGALTLTLILTLYVSAESSADAHPAAISTDRVSHQPSKLTLAQVRRLVAEVKGQRLWETHLRPFLVERVPGTAGSRAVRQHILSVLGGLGAGWALEEQSFTSSTPLGDVTFSNVLAVLDPAAPRRLLLACHHDSKILPADPRRPTRVFVGASDSATPCAIIMELVSALDSQLRALKQRRSAVTLQLVFFDGEEAFEEWTDTDSLYGSRHLADVMSRTPHPAGSTHSTLLQAVDLLVLLDLLGGPEPLILNHFDNTVRWFDRLMAAERRLHKQGLLTSHPKEQSYFRKDVYLGPVQDDHVPFLQRGVPVLHLIPTPFPVFWHTLDDSEEKMHRPTVENLTRVLLVFLAEYLSL